MRKILLFLFVSSLILQSCRVVPISGRPQLILRSEKKIIEKSKEQYYAQVDNSCKGEAPLSKEDVVKVGNNMAKAIDTYFEDNYGKNRIKGFKWEFNMNDDEAINAFCYPGGKIMFNSGIMPVCQDETGIATVMGHEIAHAIARHGNERMSRGLLTTIVLFPVLIVSVVYTGSTFLFDITKMGADLGMLRHSRAHEKEADKLGLVFMAMAGYNPEKAIDFWVRMKEESKGNVPTLLSTHPSDEKRIRNLKKFLPEAMKYYKA